MWTAPSCDSPQRSSYGNPLPGAGAVHHIIRGVSGALTDVSFHPVRYQKWKKQERKQPSVERLTLNYSAAASAYDVGHGL